MSTHNIIEIIEKIRKRPALFLGSESITALWHFLNGYHMAEYDNDIVSEPQKKLFPLDFYFMHSYVEFLLHRSGVSGWCSNILEACGGNEKAAFNKFFEIYDDFVSIGMKGYWKAELTESNIEYNNSMIKVHCCKNGKMEPIYRDPKAVYVIELSIPAYILVVETEVNVRITECFFNCADEAKGIGFSKAGAERYFGEIRQWKEFVCGNIEFNKNIERG